MIIPLGHEDLRGRRWPYVSIALILLNLVVFVATHYTMRDEAEKLGQVKLHILLVAANYPDVKMPPHVVEMVDAFKNENPKIWERIQSSNRPVEDEFDARMRMSEEFDYNREMNALVAEYDQLKSESSIERYAFVPYQPTLVSYVTANFLHGGWLHLIFNMWFLWLAGTVLEDRWGRPLYFAFYMLAGVFALIVHEAMFPTSIVPVIGASGAVSALMGAFLVRFFRTKIHFLFFYMIVLVPRFVRFQSPAWFMLPLWLGTQIFWAYLLGNQGGVAYWAHIGGFGFGLGVALLLKVTGIERKVDQAIEKEVTWEADPHVVRAGELLEANRLDDAIAELRQAIAQKPDLLDAHNLLVQATWRRQDLEAHKEAMAGVVHLHVKNKDMEAAWEQYCELMGVGGERIGASDWIALCRHIEGKQDWECAAREYEKYAHANPSDRLAVYALVSAARLRLKRLNQREEAARLYREADASPVPHLDWQDAIRRGLAEATS